jgi:hypothetical protein
VTKKLGFKLLSLATGVGLSVVLVSGCNPEEPAKTGNPPTVPPVVKPAPKPDAKAPAPAPAPKEDAKAK